jgi:hypothetical protein
MSLEHLDAIAFSFHVILLGFKLWVTYAVSKWFKCTKTPNNIKYMFIFDVYRTSLFLLCIALLLSELWFLTTFFIPGEVAFYEFLNIIGFITFITITIKYHLKEETHA